MKLTTNLLLRINQTNKPMELTFQINETTALRTFINNCYLGQVSAQVVLDEWLQWCEENHHSLKHHRAKWLVFDLLEHFKINADELEGDPIQKRYEWAKNNASFKCWNDFEKFIIDNYLEIQFFKYLEDIKIDFKKYLEPLILEEVSQRINGLVIN